MKKFFVGLILGLTITILASVSTGDKITADLINKILNIGVSTGENVCGANFILSGSTYIVDNNSCPQSISLTTNSSKGHIDLYYNNLSLNNTPGGNNKYLS
jgi:hypothetical protein